MKTIVQVKEGVLGNVLGILFLLSLCIVLFWLYTRNRLPLIIVVVFCIVNFGVSWIFVQNIRRPKLAQLVIDGEKLIWSVRNSESGDAQTNSIPLQSVRRLDFILPKMKYQINSRNYPLSELFIWDTHGNRHRLPMELWPGVNRKKIVSALEAEVPGLQVTERIGDTDQENIK